MLNEVSLHHEEQRKSSYFVIFGEFIPIPEIFIVPLINVCAAINLHLLLLFIIRKSWCATGINDTVGKFVTGVNDSDGKFATGTAGVIKWQICHRCQQHQRHK
jgi:hypothetical protein